MLTDPFVWREDEVGGWSAEVTPWRAYVLKIDRDAHRWQAVWFDGDGPGEIVAEGFIVRRSAEWAVRIAKAACAEHWAILMAGTVDEPLGDDRRRDGSEDHGLD